MKKVLLGLVTSIAVLSSATVYSMTCSCSSGSMTVTHTSSGITFTCSNGGQIVCIMK